MVEVDKSGKMVILDTVCPFCGEPDTIRVTLEGFKKYFGKSELIQNAFPELSASKREQIITGTCETCWEEHVKVEE